MENYNDYITRVSKAATLGLNLQTDLKSLLQLHGGKCEGYRKRWAEAGLSFQVGVLIYLLTYLPPYCDQVRHTDSGWVDVVDWVIAQYNGTGVNGKTIRDVLDTLPVPA